MFGKFSSHGYHSRGGEVGSPNLALIFALLAFGPVAKFRYEVLGLLEGNTVTCLKPLKIEVGILVGGLTLSTTMGAQMSMRHGAGGNIESRPAFQISNRK